MTLALLMVPWSAGATLESIEEQTFITVRELMRLEGEMALEAARRRRGQTGPVSGLQPATRAPAAASVLQSSAESLRLVGIYGVGKRLFAEVRSGSRAWLFQNGRSLPVGSVAGEEVYRLKEVAGACVRLEQKGDETVLCLSRGGKQ